MHGRLCEESRKLSGNLVDLIKGPILDDSACDLRAKPQVLRSA